MVGRGLYAPTSTGDAVIPAADDPAAHAAVFSAVTPMLGDADLSVVTLGSPLVDDPYVGGARPEGYHPDRPVVLASSTATAGALADAGVDVVNLANNHVYDALDAGLDSTLAALDGAGVAHVGRGSTEAEAWQPAYVDAGDQRVAFLGCTAFGGSRYADPLRRRADAGRRGALRRPT